MVSTPASTPPSGAVPHSLPRSSLGRRFVARWPLYTAWVALALLAVSGFWAQSHATGLSGAAGAFAYLVAGCAALFLPGYLLELGGVPLPTLRRISLAVIIVTAGLAAGTIAASLLWATPLLILLAGNAIWTLDTIDLDDELRRRRTAVASGSPRG